MHGNSHPDEPAFESLHAWSAESVVGTLEVEEWAIAVLPRDHTSAPDAWVRASWVHVEPEQTDRLADLYRIVLLPQIVEFEGSLQCEPDDRPAVGPRRLVR